MKRIIYSIAFTILFTMTAGSVFAQNVDQQAQSILKERGEIYFKFNTPEKSVCDVINQYISVEEINGNEVVAYANARAYEVLKEFNVEIELLTPPSMLYKPKMFGVNDIKSVEDWDAYPTYDAFVQMMNDWATNYPEICQLINIETLASGRELLIMKISDNVTVSEDEPEFLYTATMHGDETAGYIVMMRLIEELLEGYGNDDYKTSLVDNIEMYICPLANPDGTYHGGNDNIFGATRYNANNVDLNRNYPDPEDGPHPDGNDWQPETVAFMDLAEDYNFDIGANYHGGTEVVNYPWDTWAQLAADDDWWQLVSHEYADTCQEYAPNTYFDEYNDGITNGYQWYSVAGGRQDYMNYFHYCREFVLEISDVKLIPESELENHWEYNYRSVYNYLDQSLFGLRGIVTDAETGDPVRAKVEIIGHDIDNSFVYSTEDVGDYHRYLIDGTYDVTFSATGYFPQTIENVEISDYDVTVLNVQLGAAEIMADFSADDTEVAIGTSVTFTDNSWGDIVSWDWTFEGGDPATSSEQNPVIVYNTAGTYDVTLTVTNTSGTTHTLTKEEYITAAAENNMQDGSWTVCGGLFYDAGGSDSPYSANEDYTFTIYPATSGAMLTADFIEFNVEFHASCDYDWLKIYDGEDTSGELMGKYCGTDSPGLVTATNTTGALTFEFHSDGSAQEAGWKAVIECEGGMIAPTANFTASATEIEVGESVQFTDASENNPTEWAWTFEGGTPATSDEQNPAVVYNEEGTFSVSLTATNAAGSNTVEMEEYIVVGDGIGIQILGEDDYFTYPNPATKYIVVNNGDSIRYIDFISVSGETILHVEKNFDNIDISSLSKGHYILKIYTQSDKVFTKKLSKVE
jgi:PKD repeat protein